MAINSQNRQLDPQTFRRLLMAMYIQEMMRQQGQGGGPKAPQPSTLDQIYRRLNQGRDLYNKGSQAYDVVSGWLDSGPAASEAANAGWNSGADAAWEAQQKAWNAGADAAAGEAGGSTVPTTGADGSYMAAATSLLRSGQRFQGTSRDEQKAYEAAMAGPRAVAAFYTFGGSELAEGFARKQWGGTMKKFDKFMMNNPASPVFVPMQTSKLWTSDKWKTEGNRVKKLLEAGVEVPEQFRGRMYQKRGLSKKELVNPKYAQDFQGMTADGWVNNKFQNSRNESDMTYFDLAPYAVWAEKRNDWWKLSDAQRRAITDRAQAAGAVREHKGTLDVDWDKVGDIDQLIKSAPGVQQQIARPGKGQVARVSAGMYMNDRGQVGRALTRNQAMQQNYGQRQIPRGGKR